MSGRVPPSSQFGKARLARTEIERAANRYRRFTGHEPEEIGYINVPPLPKAAAVIGEVDGIMYTTVRDGRVEKYIHTFNKKDKPVFAVSPDGKQILLIGGNYTFTERGIVDKSDKSR